MYVFTVEGGARELRRLWDFEKVEAEAEGGCCWSCWPSLLIEASHAEGGGEGEEEERRGWRRG